MGGDALRLGKVTVGMASPWPCVTDNSGITIYELMALGREMSTPPIPSKSVAIYLLSFPPAENTVWATVLATP